MDDTALLLRAIRFAADKHRDQRRKDPEASPYINHPIQVAEILSTVGGVRDPVTLAAAVLHDTLEDTKTTPAELEQHFGPEVRRIVEEVTDDKSLEKAVRKRLQIEHAPSLSERAALVKHADKIANVLDVTARPPEGWDARRRREYLAWTKEVLDACPRVAEPLRRAYDEAYAAGMARLDQTNIP